MRVLLRKALLREIMVDSFFWQDPDTLADKEEEEM
jgi:hypothetical protein